MACSTPPAMAHNAMRIGQRPPCRLRASPDETVSYQRTVDGRLMRQAIKGEKTSNITSVTRGQKLPDFTPRTRLTIAANPTSREQHIGDDLDATREIAPAPHSLAIDCQERCERPRDDK